MPEKLTPPYQVPNPSKSQRNDMVKYLLYVNERPDDYANVTELLSPPEDITTVCPKSFGKNFKVAVIGAGDAGLSAAFELRKIGCNITLFEASDRVGGRVYTHYFNSSKKYFGDLGAMRLSPSHETTWHYVDLFKLNSYPFASKNINGSFYIRGAYAKNDPAGKDVMDKIYPRFNLTPEERRTPWSMLSGRIINKYLTSIPANLRKELIEIKKNYSDYIKLVDNLSYRQAYESVGLSEDAIAMLGYLSQFEAIFFKLSLTEVLQEAYTVDFSYNYYLDSGMASLPNALYNALTDKINVYEGVSRDELGKVALRMHTAVEGIFSYNTKGCITLCSRDTQSNTCSFENYDYVVCAIPFSSLRRTNINPLFSVRKMQAIRELNYEDGHKTFLFLKDRFWEEGLFFPSIYGGNNLNDLPSISIYYPSDHILPVSGILNAWTKKPEASAYEQGVLLAAYNWVLEASRLGSEKPELLISDVLRYVEMAHRLPPGYLSKRLLSYAHLNWQDVQYIWGGSCLGKVLDKIVFSYNIAQSEMNDRVFFAGEHISQKHGWQQGSFQTAMIAANEIAKRIKARKG